MLTFLLCLLKKRVLLETRVLLDLLDQVALKWVWLLDSKNEDNRQFRNFLQCSCGLLMVCLTHITCNRDLQDLLDPLVRMDLMVSLDLLDHLDLVDALESLAQVWVHIKPDIFTDIRSIDMKRTFLIHFVFLSALIRVHLVTLDPLVLPVPLALALTCLPSLGCLRLRRDPILCVTCVPTRPPALLDNMMWRWMPHWSQSTARSRTSAAQMAPARTLHAPAETWNSAILNGRAVRDSETI